MNTLKYLALGDSYTIGELVDYNFNFPNQTISLLKQKNIELELTDLIAVTGWTTDELKNAILEKKPSKNNDWVSLLIGVNNQYRGRSIENYAQEFEELLNMAILFAKGNVNRVVVLSIPDWGVTPFAHDRDATKIAEEIDAYNKTNFKITKQYNCHYIEITQSTRINSKKQDYLASDKLHPSAKEYTIWAERLSELIYNEVNKG